MSPSGSEARSAETLAGGKKKSTTAEGEFSTRIYRSECFFLDKPRPSTARPVSDPRAIQGGLPRPRISLKIATETLPDLIHGIRNQMP